MTKKPTGPARLPLTTEELERLTAVDLVRLKLTDDEKARLREINKAREQDRVERVARMRAEQTLLLAELQATGLKIQSVSDLINMPERYERAIPVLLKHLLINYSDVTKETIARSLAVPEQEDLHDGGDPRRQWSPCKSQLSLEIYRPICLHCSRRR